MAGKNEAHVLPDAAGVCQHRAMKHARKNPMAGIVALAAVCLLAATGSAPAQNAEPENAKALLEKVKRRDLDRQLAAGQTYLDRLAEDLAKGRKEAETMQTNIDATKGLQKETAAQLSQFTGQRKRLEQVIALTALRIEAEKLKGEGLQLLADAQAKSLAALNKRAEETELRASVGAAELKLLGQAEAVPATEPAGKAHASLSELRKKLAASEVLAANAEKIAREAMRAASARLDQADLAGAKAKKKAGMVEGDLPEIAEKPVDLEEKQPAPVKKAAPPK